MIRPSPIVRVLVTATAAMLAIGAFARPALSASNDAPDTEARFVAHVQRTTGWSPDVASVFLDAVIHHMAKIQAALTDLGSTKLPPLAKRSVKERVLRELFIGSDATVQVSSLNSANHLKVYSLSDYLDRLISLSIRYTRIELFCDDSYLLMSTIAPSAEYPNTYELSVTLRQFFTAYNGDGVRVYSDVTKKAVRLYVFYDGTAFVIRTGDVVVRETYDPRAQAP